MSTFRVMSYNLKHTHSDIGAQCADLCTRVVRTESPDLVMLQQVGSPVTETSLQRLSDRVGLAAYGSDTEGSCAFLSRHPLHNLQTIPLGYGDICVRADFDQASERVHLLNLTLSWHPGQRFRQVTKLLGEEILGSNSFPCATIIAGDFGLPLWGCGQVAFNPQIVRAQQPAWRANYPASFPLWGRGRIYFQGPIRALDGKVVRSKEARDALNQLPLIVYVETRETRKTLKVKDHVTMSSKQPKPVCG
ncbi:MAG: hypothetical protein R6V33_08830 [Pelovirga sp.]